MVMQAIVNGSRIFWNMNLLPELRVSTGEGRCARRVLGQKDKSHKFINITYQEKLLALNQTRKLPVRVLCSLSLSLCYAAKLTLEGYHCILSS